MVTEHWNLKDAFCINLNKMVNMAIKEFITKPHTIELGPISDSEWEKATKKSYKKHKKAMVELSK